MRFLNIKENDSTLGVFLIYFMRNQKKNAETYDKKNKK